MSTNSFDARTTLEVSGTTYEIFDLHKVEGSDTLPFSLKVLLCKTGSDRGEKGIKDLAEVCNTAKELLYTA